MEWPDRSRWIAYLKFLALFDLLFFPIFLGGAWLQRASGRAIDLYFAAELKIPFVPWMIFPYLSLFPLFVLPLLHLGPEGMATLSRRSALSLATAAAVFVALPARVGFGPRPDAGPLQPLFDLLGAVDTTAPFTAVPSLHVAFAGLILLTCAEVAPRRLAALYGVWLAALAASTVLTHQHNLADVAGGFALAIGVRRIVPDRAAVTAGPDFASAASRPPGR